MFWTFQPLPVANSYQHDSNGDGVPEEHANPTDPNDGWWSLDSDGDQLTNAEEVIFSSDPYSMDSDLDGLTDRDERDLSQTHPWQWDSDSDGYSDHNEFYSCYTVNYNDLISQAVSFTSYFDADGDGAHNHQDSHPLDNLWWNDWNGNGTSDDQEWTPPDSDGDGQPDPSDSHPNDPTLWNDWNNSGVNDENDPPPDWDGDGVADPWDTHPNDPSLWNDHNHNGYNDDNEPPLDSDGDGEPDSTDPAPYDPNINSNTPPDRDSDGSPDSSDTDPDDPGLWEDHNRNGVNDSVEPDSDGDGIINGSDPYPEDPENNLDSDGDGVSNYLEQQHGTNTGMVDTDQDGLTDLEEIATYRPLYSHLSPTNPHSLSSVYLDYQVVDATDSDNDGIPNRIEQWYASNGELMDPANPADADGDLDGDGYTNLQAYVNGWNLTANRDQYDFDGDRITDVQEDYWHGLHPGSLDKTRFADAVADFDQDGLFNYEELQLGTDLADANSLHPLLTDGQVQTWQRGIAIPGRYGYDPADPSVALPAPAAHTTWDDLDNDGIPDGFANYSATITGGIVARAAHPVDEDQDGMSNGFEHLHHLNPRDASDAGPATGLVLHPPANVDPAAHQLAQLRDADEDGLSNLRESQENTHPRYPDTDGDGHSDGAEIAGGSNPTQPGSTPSGGTGPGSGSGPTGSIPGPFANPGLKPIWQPTPSTLVQDGYKIGLVERRREVTSEVVHHGGSPADPENGVSEVQPSTEVRVYLQPLEEVVEDTEEIADWLGGGWAGWSDEHKTQFVQDVNVAHQRVTAAEWPTWESQANAELLEGGASTSWAGLLEGIEMSKAEYRLERRAIAGQAAPVDGEGNPIKPEVRRTFLKVKESLASSPTGKVSEVLGTVEFVIAEGEDVSSHTEVLPTPNFNAGEVALRLLPMEVNWEAKEDWDNIDDHKDPWTNEINGKRIFPDATAPNGEMRRELSVKVKSGNFANQTFHLKVFDVDDPSAAPDPQHKLDENDSNTKKAGDDNLRGAGLLADWGHFLPQQTKKIVVLLDANGEAEVEFKVNQQPGNNYRVAVALQAEDFDYLQVSDSNAAGYITPDDKPVQNFKGSISPMLTVWRKLHIEVDSMNAPPAERASPEWTTATGDHWGTDDVGAHVLHLSSTLPEGDKFYAGGIIKAGSTQLIIKENDKYSITLSGMDQSPTQAQLDSCIGPIKVFDDDDRGLPGPGLPSVGLISTGVKDIYKQAYIDIVEVASSLNPNNRYEFESHINQESLFTTINDKKDTEGDDWLGYWAHYLVAAYQPVPDESHDPSSANLTQGHTLWGGLLTDYYFVDFSVIFTETIREKVQIELRPTAPSFAAQYQVRLDEVVAHEIGHLPRKAAGHYEPGLMRDGGPEWTGDVNHHLSVESILRFRKTPSWGASW